jgi:SPX domain protein involved in polyphosphate accumulation
MLFADELEQEVYEELKLSYAENERLRGLIKEAIRLARRNHYGNMYIEIENFAEGISLLETNLEEPGK